MIVHKSISVARPPDVAFKLFVDQMGEWWPKDTGHSFLGGNTTLVVEPKAGGHFYEKSLDNDDIYVIGEVLAYEPGTRVTFTWKHREWPDPTTVDIRFTAEGGGTRIDLKHEGWEKIGDTNMAAEYNGGWDLVLGFYERFVGK